MKKQDAKMLKQLAEFTHESYRNLKRQWRALPGKDQPKQRRKILASIENWKQQRADRKARVDSLPKKL